MKYIDVTAVIHTDADKRSGTLSFKEQRTLELTLQSASPHHPGTFHIALFLLTVYHSPEVCNLLLLALNCWIAHLHQWQVHGSLCISCFLISVTRYMTKTNDRRTLLPIIPGDTWCQNLEEAGPLSAIRKQRHEFWCSVCFLLFM